MHAYHTPEFSTNEISVIRLSEHINIKNTCDHPGQKGNITCVIKNRTDGDLFNKLKSPMD